MMVVSGKGEHTWQPNADWVILKPDSRQYHLYQLLGVPTNLVETAKKLMQPGVDCSKVTD
jgi:hypothetical protein